MQDKLDITNKTRSNLLKWNAQFSPELIEHFLELYSRPGMTVLDPFLGSGTVVVESARLSLDVIGIELNPAASILSSIYQLCNMSSTEREVLIEKLTKTLNRTLVSSQSGKEFSEKLLHASSKDTTELLVMRCMIVMIDFSKDLELDTEKVLKVWTKLSRVISELPYSSALINIINNDSRHLSLESNSIDLVITSPPYINVFNYHQQYRNSVELLGYDVLSIAKNEIGANRKNRSNRYKTVISYGYEIKDILDELSRVTKKDSRVIFVVGRQSNILGTPFYNGDIVEAIATSSGLKTADRQQRKFQNRFGQIIYEDIIHFINTKQPKKDNVKKIIKNAFTNALSYTEKESSKKLIQEATDYIDLFEDQYRAISNHATTNSTSRKT